MKTSKTGLLSLAVATLLLVSESVFPQATKTDIFGSGQITWLGLDFTQAKFIGSAFQFKDAGEITNEEFRDKYAPAWNQLFINEAKKYNVAEAVNRVEVKYATDVTDKANSSIKDAVFTNNPDDYNKLSEDKISHLVKSYDFKGNKGIGLLFFVDGLSKVKEEANVWVTFVNLDNKTVLLTKNVKGKAGGFGFRNYWAGALNRILKDVKSDFKKWQ
jgi:hypothetical protein